MAKRMDERTLEALKGSIRKWEGIVAGTVKDEGRENCPLCQVFFPLESSPHYPAFILRNGRVCMDCPVFKRTKKRGCAGSPYDDYEDSYEEAEKLGTLEQPQVKQALTALAQKELDFLKTLLPHEEDEVST